MTHGAHEHILRFDVAIGDPLGVAVRDGRDQSVEDMTGQSQAPLADGQPGQAPDKHNTTFLVQTCKEAWGRRQPALIPSCRQVHGVGLGKGVGVFEGAAGACKLHDKAHVSNGSLTGEIPADDEDILRSTRLQDSYEKYRRCFVAWAGCPITWIWITSGCPPMRIMLVTSLNTI